MKRNIFRFGVGQFHLKIMTLLLNTHTILYQICEFVDDEKPKYESFLFSKRLVLMGNKSKEENVFMNYEKLDNYVIFNA